MKIVGKQGNPCFKEVDKNEESRLKPAYESVYFVKEEEVKGWGTPSFYFLVSGYIGEIANVKTPFPK